MNAVSAPSGESDFLRSPCRPNNAASVTAVTGVSFKVIMVVRFKNRLVSDVACRVASGLCLHLFSSPSTNLLCTILVLESWCGHQQVQHSMMSAL